MESHANTADIPPSKVVHIRHVDPEANKQDLQALCAPFGNVERVVLTRSKNQALVQFTDLHSAFNFIQWSMSQPLVIKNQTAIAQYSTFQDLTGEDRPPKAAKEAAPPNTILLATVVNPAYSITVDVINQVFSRFGLITKVIIFQKSAGLQVLLQFQEIESAIQAQRSLNGLNIYPGCCLLQIQFSNLQELAVRYNNDRSRDFTNPYLPTGENHDRERPRPTPNSHMQRNPDFSNPSQMANYFAPNSFMPQQYGFNARSGRCVIDVGNLSPEVTCDHLFNLFSNYGNVVAIRFMYRKPEHALVQMADGSQANNAVSFLKGIPVRGAPLEMNLTNFRGIQTNASDMDPEKAKDYSNSALNRFSNPQAAQRNTKRLCHPSLVLHISNLAPAIDEQGLSHILGMHGVVQDIKVFETSMKRQAFIQVNNIHSSVNIMMQLNGAEIAGRPIRISFSSRTSIQPLATTPSHPEGSAPEAYQTF
eukprot:TRINITY_DN2156_c0_g1_i1.p1 TRINITY_DN2156_c0_g1~~TRINITY_DN2156_c0_g1_i1.p1  ORF type:complete len:477 (+),score=107.14 TRINITY_DN2156_c0_g1_i1:70-1500(+)